MHSGHAAVLVVELEDMVVIIVGKVPSLGFLAVRKLRRHIALVIVVTSGNIPRHLQRVCPKHKMRNPASISTKKKVQTTYTQILPPTPHPQTPNTPPLTPSTPPPPTPHLAHPTHPHPPPHPPPTSHPTPQ